MSIDEIPRQLGRYVLYDRIATGGMATVHFGRMRGAIGFSRLVAIKRLRPNFANDVHFVQMFLDEARLAARLEHPNVVSTLDVVADETEVFLVMEHVLGDSLEALMRDGIKRVPVPIGVISAIVCGVLEGLHFAHEARGDDGEPLEIVHRDVSPHNILVGVDGVARVFDFGIAKASTNTQETREGVVKGKVAYMAPEQVRGVADRRADIYAAGVILWELLAGRRRHAGERNDSLFLKLARNELAPPQPPSTIRRDCPLAVDEIVACATHAAPEHRFATAREMAVALEAAVPPAPAREVAEWIRMAAGTRIERVAEVMRRIEADRAVSDSRLTSAPLGSASSSSVHVLTASIRPSDSASARVGTYEHSRASERPAVEPRSRNWTMPAALLAFTAALLLVGARTLANRKPDRSANDAAAVTTAIAAATGAPVPEVVSVVPPSAVSQASGSAVVTAAAPGASTSVNAAPPAVTDVSRVARSSPPAAPPPRVVQHTPAPAAPPPRQKEAAPAAAQPSRAEPTAPPATNAGTKPGCENPFAIGSDGIRQIKPECL